MRHGGRHSNNSGTKRRDHHFGRGGYRHSDFRPLQDQPGNRLHPGRDRRRSVRARRADRAISRGWIGYRSPTQMGSSRSPNSASYFLLFSIGLELSFRRLVAMRKMVFGIGAAEMLLTAALIGGALICRQPATDERALARIGAGDVLDRAGAADIGHAKPGRTRRAGDAAVRGSGAGSDAVSDRRGRRGGIEQPRPDRG